MKHTAVTVTALLVLLVAAGTACRPDPARPRADREPPPNLVVICFDTVRYDSFRAIDEHGHGDALSPWLARGVRFTRAQAPAPWTIPSVASLFTGLPPRSHGAGRFPERVANLNDQVPSPLPEAVPTLPAVLDAAGYVTVGFVAHPWFKPEFGLDRGFGRVWFRQGNRILLRDGREWLDDHLADDPATPFFLYLHFMEAHERHMEPRAEVEETAAALPPAWREAALATAPAGICDTPQGKWCLRYQAYLDAVRDLRASLAGLLRDLDERALLDNTRVLLYSDHGEEFHDHLEEGRIRDADPRGFAGVGHGHSLYQELLHVPLVLWDPARPAGTMERPVSLTDVAASLLPAPEPAAGLSGPGLFPGDGTGDGRPLFSSGIAYGPPQATVVLWPWKRIVLTEPSERLLFHLEDDPGERTPVTDEPDMARELDRLLAAYLRLDPAASAETPTLSEEEMESLRALGYLGGRQ